MGDGRVAGAEAERYSRQVLFAPVGAKGQQRLRSSRVLVVGCGALGSAHVEALVRAGVGRVRVADRDFVEASNLQRQTMFTERDARERLPKAIAAARRAAEINSDVEVEPHVLDVTAANVEALLEGCDVVLDGTDNFATRYLVNDACHKHQVSWVYGAAVGSYGVSMTVRPRETPCLRCVFPEPPGAGAPTCDTAGVIMPIISVVAAVQVSEAMKLLTGRVEDLHGSLMQFDVWRNEWRRLRLPRETSPECSACAGGRYESLEAGAGGLVTVLCGRDAVQVSPARPSKIDLVDLAARLRPAGEVSVNAYLLRLRAGAHELTIFADARAIVRGTDDPAAARTLYARYVGD